MPLRLLYVSRFLAVLQMVISPLAIRTRTPHPVSRHLTATPSLAAWPADSPTPVLSPIGPIMAMRAAFLAVLGRRALQRSRPAVHTQKESSNSRIKPNAKSTERASEIGPVNQATFHSSKLLSQVRPGCTVVHRVRVRPFRDGLWIHFMP